MPGTYSYVTSYGDDTVRLECTVHAPGASAATRTSIQRERGTIAPAIDLEVLLQACGSPGAPSSSLPAMCV